MRKACGVEVLLFEIARCLWIHSFFYSNFKKAKPQGVSSKSDLPLERQTYILCDKTVLQIQQGTSDPYEIPPAAVFAAQLRFDCKNFDVRGDDCNT